MLLNIPGYLVRRYSAESVVEFSWSCNTSLYKAETVIFINFTFRWKANYFYLCTNLRILGEFEYLRFRYFFECCRTVKNVFTNVILGWNFLARKMQSCVIRSWNFSARVIYQNSQPEALSTRISIQVCKFNRYANYPGVIVVGCYAYADYAKMCRTNM